MAGQKFSHTFQQIKVNINKISRITCQENEKHKHESEMDHFVTESIHFNCEKQQVH